MEAKGTGNYEEHGVSVLFTDGSRERVSGGVAESEPARVRNSDFHNVSTDERE